MSYAEAIGNPPSIEWVAPARLAIDPTYQRSIESSASAKLIDEIAAGWDWRLCVPLLVSRRAGALFVIDGQHRLEGAKRRGDIPHLPCCISTYDDAAEEARLFVAANRRRRAINRVDDFRAAVAAGDPVAVAINGMIEQAGLTIAKNANGKNIVAGEVSFITALKSAFAKRGAANVAAALTQMGEAFPDEVLTHGGAIFSALVEIHALDGLDQDRLFRALLTHNAAGWGNFASLAAAKGGTGRALAVRHAIRDAYAQTPAEAD